MSDTDETKRPAKTLSLKKTETSTVKQSFSHGRTKAVVVEKKRSAAPPAAAAAKPAAKPAEKPVEKAAAPAPAAAKAAAPARGVVLRQLSDEEKARRAAALADARVSDSEARRMAEQEAERKSRRGKLTGTRALPDDNERGRSAASYKPHLQRVNKGHQRQPAAPAGPRDITLPETITVADLANRMARRTVDVIKVLMKNGMMATPNDVIDADTAELVASEYGHVVKRVAESDVLEGLMGAKDDAANLER